MDSPTVSSLASEASSDDETFTSTRRCEVKKEVSFAGGRVSASGQHESQEGLDEGSSGGRYRPWTKEVRSYVWYWRACFL